MPAREGATGFQRLVVGRWRGRGLRSWDAGGLGHSMRLSPIEHRKGFASAD